jgi:hypothetical protein
VWLPCGNTSNWYSGLEYCIGSGVDLGFVCRSCHWCNQGYWHSWDWLSELNLGLPCPTRLASIQHTPKGISRTAYIPVNAPINTYQLPELLDWEIAQECLPYYYSPNLGQVLVSPSRRLYPEPQSELAVNPSTSKDPTWEKSPSWEDKNTPSDSGIPQLKDLSH